DLVGLNLPSKAFPEIDDAGVTESGNLHSGFGVERDQLIARRDQENSLVAASVGPIGQTAIVVAWSALAANAFVQLVGPFLITAGCVERDCGALRSSREVQRVPYHERCGLPVVVRRLAQRGSLPAPDD